MTPDEIAALRALCANATPGPWKHEPGSPLVFIAGMCYGRVHTEADAAFIAAAREALPRLLDELERLATDYDSQSQYLPRLDARVEKLEAALRRVEQLEHSKPCTAARLASPDPACTCHVAIARAALER